MDRTLRAARTLTKAAERLQGPPTLRPAGEPAFPALWFFTDPARTPRPIAIVSRLPAGTGVVYRHFGRPGAAVEAEALAEAAAARDLVLLIAADPRLAAHVGAAGVHLPVRMVQDMPRLRRRHGSWLLTAAVHSARAARRAAHLGADALFAAPVFPTNSPSGRRPLGPMRFAAIARATPVPTFALGGVDPRAIRRLAGRGAAGVAAVEAVARNPA
ncbi:MAG: thiamine phosphate synthase [Caulobacterales bacterium]|nr:thiamine phosphate synthase [Caulobacterales bacterium]